MCKIIQFPTNRIQKSNGFKNLESLFEICDSLEACNLYLNSAEQLFENGSITENELYTLRRVGRQKRLDLATPAPQEPHETTKPGTYCYTPEMGQKKPDGCQIEATRAYYGKHMYIDTPMTLKGRGITLLKQYKPGDLLTDRKNGWNHYQVTNLAFKKLKEQYTISIECCLD